jgi:ribonuclease HI
MRNSTICNSLKSLLLPVHDSNKFFSKLPLSPKQTVHVEPAPKRPKLDNANTILKSTEIFYTVLGGNSPGIYTSWAEVEAEIFGIETPIIHKFGTKINAQAHLDTFIPPNKQEPIGKFYAVLRGKTPGIYKTWEQVQEQTKGLYSSSIRIFDTLLEAQNHFNEFSIKLHSESDPDPRDANTLVAFCDGSAFGNGKKNCKAGFATVFPHNEGWNIMKKLAGICQTNNRAEYWSAIEAMKRANKEDPLKVKPLFIFSDSMLLIKSMTEWIEGWLKRNWVKSDGKAVENVDLLKTLVAESKGRRVIWRHVKAHTNKKDWESVWNDRVDGMAKDAANGRELIPLT